MLYYIKLAKDNKEYKVALLSKVENSIFGFRALIGSAQVIPFISNYGDKVLIDSIGDKVYPTLSSEVSGTTLDITKIWEFFSKNELFDKYEMLYEKLGKHELLPVNILKDLKQAVTEFSKYQKDEEPVKIEVPELFFTNLEKNREIVRDYNSRLGHKFVHIRPEINKTNFMASETDMFFIELPEYDKLRNYDLDMSALTPNTKDIAVPYPHPIYQTPFARKYLEQGPSQKRETIKLVEEWVNLTEEEKIDVPRIDLTRVEGSVENNDLDIQDNEIDFFEALKEYIMYDITQTYPDKDAEELYKNNTCSPRMEEFINTLIEISTRMNWTHSGVFPVGYLDEDDDEESDYNEENSGADSKVFRDWEGTGKITDGPAILSSFLKEASEDTGMGFDVFIEAIIKLFRWGSVKPSRLKLGNYNRFLDLNTFYVRTTAGSISSMKSILVDGYELVPQGYIVFDDRYRDTEFKNKIGLDVSKIDIPVGLICQRHFNEGVTQTVYVSILDIFEKYSKDPNSKFIKGIDLKDGKLTVSIEDENLSEITSLRMVRESVNSTMDKLFVYHTSDDLKSLMLDYKASNLSILRILYDQLHQNNSISTWYHLLKFSNKEELQKRLVETPLAIETFLSVNIAHLIIPVILEASEKYSLEFMGTYNLEKILKYYEDSINKYSYNSPSDFLSQKDPVESKLQNMKHFEENKELEDTKEEDIELEIGQSELSWSSLGEFLTKELIVPISKEDNVTSIVENAEIIGGFTVKAINGVNVYVIGDSTVVPKGTAPSRNSLRSIETLVFDLVSKLLHGQGNKAQVRFHSLESLKFFRTYLNKALKGSR